MWYLRERTSAKLLQWYLGPDHRSKLRLWRYLLTALGHPRLSVPYAGSGTITLDYRDWLQSTILRTGTYEPEVWNAISSVAGNDSIFWDVGAHIGTFSILACRDSRFRVVHAFEPAPEASRVLRHHLAVNPGVSRVIHQLALGSSNEKRVLTAGPAINSGMASLIRTSNPGRRQSVVQCTTADTLVFERGIAAPTIIKIDVEGWELEVLYGAERILTERPPAGIIFEAACERSAPELDDSAIAEYLETKGYSVSYIPRPDGHVEPRENYIAIHHER